MPRRARGLTVALVKSASAGRYGDGAGLYLRVRDPQSKFWVFRYRFSDRIREMGLGTASGPVAVPLAEVRMRRDDLRRLLRQGVDPLAARDDAKAEAQRKILARRTFKEVALLYIANHEASWRNATHRAQWDSSLTAYVYPVIGHLPIAEVTTAQVTAILEPIWQKIPQTASRVRGRLESILDFAKARGWRTGENPARWKGHLDHILPRVSKLAPVAHLAALPWQRMGTVMSRLVSEPGIAALALRFTVLTAARTSEARLATWSEIDIGNAVWTLPAVRMKGGRPHRVPLSSAALDVLAQVASARMTMDSSEFVFPGVKRGQPLSDRTMLSAMGRLGFGDVTVHGFRSTFRDWCAEHAGVAREIAEAALAHVVGDKVEAAYARTDYFDRRRKLMEAWGQFCTSPEAEMQDNVLPLRREA